MNDLRKTLIIANYTMREIIKSKILINVLLLGIGLLLVTFVAYSFTYGDPSRIALDFGLGTLSISSIGISIFIGVSLLANEIDNRTVYMIISRPVPRYSFILGRILGLSGVLTINIFILSLLTFIVFFTAGGSLNQLIFLAVFFIGLEAVLMLLVVSLLSLVTSKTLSVVMSIVIYIVGHAINQTQLISFAQSNAFFKTILPAYQFILPAFYKLNLKDFVIYKSQLELSYIFSSMGYAVLYGGMLVMLSIYIFNKKNLD
jgi:ABC-type transport system involved in multi-copper enzyme maturation permease subunit